MRKTLTHALCLTVILAAPLASADDVVNVWNERCKNCHGEDGKAQTRQGQKEKVKDVTTPEWQAKHTDAEIRQVISEGSPENKKMKPFKDKLSAAEIDALVAYIRSLGGKK